MGHSMKMRVVHSKNSGSSNLTCMERVHWGQTPFRVNDDPEISRLDAEYDRELDQSDPIIFQVCRQLTKPRVTFDPELSMTPMDPLPGHVDWGVLECNKTKILVLFSNVKFTLSLVSNDLETH